jgi:hypothetical protein
VSKTLSVPEAGRIYFGLGRNASYAAAKRGEIPTIKIGSRLRVPVMALERMLEEASARSAPIVDFSEKEKGFRGTRHQEGIPS